MGPDALHLLLLENDATEELRIRDALGGSRVVQFDLERVLAPADAARRLERGGVDVLLADLASATETTLEFLREVMTRTPDVSVVVLADDPGHADSLRALRAGADECLSRASLGEPSLGHALRWAIERHRLLAQSRKRSLRDEVTGFYNVNGFLAVTDPLWRLAARTGRPLTLLLLYFDRLDQIKLEHGAEVEAAAIAGAAEVLGEIVRESDVLARIGHDRFMLLLNDAEERAAEIVLMRALDAIEEWNGTNEQPWRLSFSITFAHFDPASPKPVETLLREAEQALAERRLRSFRIG